MSVDILRIAAILDEKEEYRLSDKLYRIAQINVVQNLKNFTSNPYNLIAPVGLYNSTKPFQQGAANFLGQGLEPLEGVMGAKDQIMQPAEVIKSVNDRIVKPFSKVQNFITKNLPIIKTNLNGLIKFIESAEKSQVGSVLGKVFKALSLLSLTKNVLELILNIEKDGFETTFKNNPSFVINTTSSFIGAITDIRLGPAVPPVIPLIPIFRWIHLAMAALPYLVQGAESLGTAMNTSNTALRNNQGTYAKTSVMPLDQLADKYGEVYNTLIDYVNGRGTVAQLLATHLPDNNPEKMALVNAHIAQKVLPPKNAPYVKSSYKRAQEKAQQQAKETSRAQMFSPGSGGMGYSPR